MWLHKVKTGYCAHYILSRGRWLRHGHDGWHEGHIRFNAHLLICDCSGYVAWSEQSRRNISPQRQSINSYELERLHMSKRINCPHTNDNHFPRDAARPSQSPTALSLISPSGWGTTFPHITPPLKGSLTAPSPTSCSMILKQEVVLWYKMQDKVDGIREKAHLIWSHLPH